MISKTVRRPGSPAEIGKWKELTDKVLATLDNDTAEEFKHDEKTERLAARSACWGPANKRGLVLRSKHRRNSMILWVERREIDDEIPEL